jgi:hypothetical protein
VENRAVSCPLLIRPVTPNDRPPLRTLDDVCAYMDSLPRTRQWETVAGLVREARNSPTATALDELTRQVEIALFLDGRLDPASFAIQLAELLGRVRAPSRDAPGAAP